LWVLGTFILIRNTFTTFKVYFNEMLRD